MHIVFQAHANPAFLISLCFTNADSFKFSNIALNHAKGKKFCFLVDSLLRRGEVVRGCPLRKKELFFP